MRALVVGFHGFFQGFWSDVGSFVPTCFAKFLKDNMSDSLCRCTRKLGFPIPKIKIRKRNNTSVKPN